MYHLFFHCIQKIMWCISIFWMIVVLQRFWNLPLGFSGLCLLICLLLVWKRERTKKVYHWGMQHKSFLMIGAILFQIGVILSANLLVRRDAAVVIQGALEMIESQSISRYLTRNPNNLPMFLYARGLYRLFGSATLWVLQFLGMVSINLTAYILYRTGRDFLSQEIADRAFCLYLFLLGFSPYVIQTYTDITSLPFLAGQLYLMIAIIRDGKKYPQRLVMLGFLTAVATILRPTAFISVIAFILLFLLKGNWKQFFQYMMILLSSTALFFGSLRYAIHQQKEVEIIHDETLAKGITTFINLGLTYSGTDQEDMKQGLLQYIEPEKRQEYHNGMFAQENEIKEIKRRLQEYTPVTFLGHLSYKLSKTLYDGGLNWIYLDPSKEKTPLISPLYALTKENRVAEVFRQTVIQYDGTYYPYYQTIKQCIWAIMVLGLVLGLWRYRPDDTLQFLSLAVFGGLLFLMIFEGGKTRYLLQFFPQILLLSSIGLATISEKDRKR